MGRAKMYAPRIPHVSLPNVLVHIKKEKRNSKPATSSAAGPCTGDERLTGSSGGGSKTVPGSKSLLLYFAGAISLQPKLPLAGQSCRK